MLFPDGLCLNLPLILEEGKIEINIVPLGKSFAPEFTVISVIQVLEASLLAYLI